MIKNSPDLINASRGEEGTPLFQAATKGQLQVATFLLDHGAKVNVAASGPEKSWTPLMAAANSGHKAMVELLLDRGANVDAQSQSGDTALLRAAEKGFVGVAETLLAHKANVSLGRRDGKSITLRASSPLHAAVSAGASAMMELLLRHGANVNATNSQGETPLMLAADGGRLAVVKTLLAAKADVNRQSALGRTALSYAADGQSEIVKALLAAQADPNGGTVDLPLAVAVGRRDLAMADTLLRAGADPNLAGKISNRQSVEPLGALVGSGPYGPYVPLQIAVARNDVAMTKLLLEFKADANTQDPRPKQRSPLLFANASDNPEMLQAFLETGADANADRWSGWPMLVNACFTSNERAVQLLLAHGAKTETKSSQGRTPLSYAAEKDCLKCAQLLLEAKADANAATPDGVTALHWAAANGAKNVAEALIAHGADVNRESEYGDTPLFWAMRCRDTTKAQAVIKLLLEKGADPNTRNQDGLTPLDLAKGKRAISQPGSHRSVLVEAPTGAQSAASEIAALLREHGALDELPDFNSLRVTRAGWPQPMVVFRKDTNSVNQFTLLEVVLNFYGISSEFGNAPPTDIVQRYGITSYGYDRGMPFPDFSKLIVHRPRAGQPGAEQELKFNLLTATNRFDCAKDTWLKFGDVVEIPEREHALSESSVGLTADQQAQLRHCLGGKVTFVVRGQKAELALDGTAETCRLEKALGRINYLLRSSSDLSRIKIQRTDPATGKTTEFFANGKLTGADDLWLRNGDVIEVSDKP